MRDLTKRFQAVSKQFASQRNVILKEKVVSDPPHFIRESQVNKKTQKTKKTPFALRLSVLF
jgi:hypothetical protein